MVIDPTLRILRVVPFATDGSDAAQLFDYLVTLPPPERVSGIELHAPILYLPNVCEPELCRELIARYEAYGGHESGFMREIDGKTVIAQDHAHKRRKDYVIDDAELIRRTQALVKRRIRPEVKKAYAFDVTR